MFLLCSCIIVIFYKHIFDLSLFLIKKNHATNNKDLLILLKKNTWIKKEILAKKNTNFLPEFELLFFYLWIWSILIVKV